MEEVHVIGIDSAKYGHSTPRSLRGRVDRVPQEVDQNESLGFLASRPRCLMSMEACASAHFGFAPRKRQSGEVYRTGRISKCGDAIMHAMLYEAANILLERTTRWSWLKAWAMGVAKRQGKARAKVAPARELGVIMDRSEFRWKRKDVDTTAAWR